MTVHIMRSPTVFSNCAVPFFVPRLEVIMKRIFLDAKRSDDDISDIELPGRKGSLVMSSVVPVELDFQLSF